MSKIELNDLIKNKTAQYLQTLNTQSTLSHLIFRIPISEITRVIESDIKSYIGSHQQSINHDLTSQAMQKQAALDLDEEKSDTQYLKNYPNVLNELKSELDRKNSLFSDQQTQISMLDQRIRNYKLDLAQLRDQINSVNSQINVLKTHQNQAQSGNSPTTHRHQSQIVQNPSVHQHLSAQTSQIHLLGRQLLDLNTQMTQLSTHFRLQSDDYTKIKTESSNLEKDIKNLQNRISIEIPNEKNQCVVREAQRIARNKARHGHDTELNQLSDQVKKALASEIEKHLQELSQHENELITELHQSSYPHFVDQLLTQLEQKPWAFHADDIDSLKEIAILSRKWCQDENRLVQLREEFNQNIIHQNTLQNSLATIKSDIVQWQDTTTQLKGVNLSLGHTNKLLTQQKTSVETTQNRANKSALLLIGGGIIALALVTAATASTLFLFIPGAFALATLIAFAVSIGHAAKGRAIEKSIEENNTTLTSNAKQCDENTKRIDEYTNQMLPELETQISKSQSDATNQGEELKMLQSHIDELQYNINNLQSNTKWSFNKQGSSLISQSFYHQNPSAPLEQLSTEHLMGNNRF